MMSGRILRKHLGVTIRELRKANGHSQESFADAVGLHRTYVGSVERGERNVSLDNICRIARALDLTAAKLIALAEHRLQAKKGRAR